MRLEQLEQVVVLEEELSISKAAKVLYMTQPAAEHVTDQSGK